MEQLTKLHSEGLTGEQELVALGPHIQHLPAHLRANARHLLDRGAESLPGTGPLADLRRDLAEVDARCDAARGIETLTQFDAELALARGVPEALRAQVLTAVGYRSTVSTIPVDDHAKAAAGFHTALAALPAAHRTQELEALGKALSGHSNPALAHRLHVHVAVAAVLAGQERSAVRATYGVMQGTLDIHLSRMARRP